MTENTKVATENKLDQRDQNGVSITEDRSNQGREVKREGEQKGETRNKPESGRRKEGSPTSVSTATS